MNYGRISIDVTFPSGVQRSFKSVRRVALMLSGNGTASGGLRKNIEQKAYLALGGNSKTKRLAVVRNNRVYG